MTDTRHSGLSMLGFGVAACAACCAGPILALLGGLSVAGLASIAVIGVAGLVIAAVGAAAYLVVLRRRAATAGRGPSHEDVAVAGPTRRAPLPVLEEP